jgi:hypothetical protein
MSRNENEDLEKLRTAFYENLIIVNIEYGGIGLDPKRPFGNSDVEADILDIIGWEMEGNNGYETCYSSEQREYAGYLYNLKLIDYLIKTAF